MRLFSIDKNKARVTDHILLLVIVVAGIILRFWNYNNIQFMHDELSALSRLQFDSISDVIKYGVMLGDTHPAGIQVFLYYWTSFFGTSEISVKLPFIVSGIISIWISYKVGKLWFDETTGLLTAAMIASTQFFVMYSQIARPYVSGLLLSLLMVYYWSLYFYKNRKILYLALFVLFAVLSAYNHHFSLLFAAIIGFSGLFLLKGKSSTIAYLTAGALIFILYLPHLGIFFNQLSQGGIGGDGGWLAKPKPTFIFEYADYLQQFSIWGWLTLLGVVLFNIIPGKIVSYDKGLSKRLLLFTWFLLPIIIGYGYSVLRNPVIQYSMLIFSTPYIYMFVFSYHRKLDSIKKTIIIFLFLGVNVYGLIYKRDHYNVFYHQPYEELFKTALVDNVDRNVFIIDDCVPYYHEYYFDKYGQKADYFTKRGSQNTILDFINVVKNIENDIVVTHALTGQELQVVNSVFPYQTDRKYGFTYEIHTFSKIPGNKNSSINNQLIAQTNFSTRIGIWKDVSKYVNFDTLENTYQCELGGEIWGPSIIFNLNDYVPYGLGVFDISMKSKIIDTISKALLVSSIVENNETIYWNASNIQDYNSAGGEWTNMFLSVDIQNALRSRSNMKDLILKINVWNSSKSNLIIGDIKVSLKPGNPKRYSLYRNITYR